MSKIKTWDEVLDSQISDGQIVTTLDIKMAMQNEINECRTALKNAEQKLAALAAQEPVTARYRWHHGQSKSAWQYCLDSEKAVRAWAEDIIAEEVQMLYLTAGAVPVSTDFAAWLIDHCEGQIVSEESVQHWLSQMLAAAPKEQP